MNSRIFSDPQKFIFETPKARTAKLGEISEDICLTNT